MKFLAPAWLVLALVLPGLAEWPCSAESTFEAANYVVTEEELGKTLG